MTCVAPSGLILGTVEPRAARVRFPWAQEYRPVGAEEGVPPPSSQFNGLLPAYCGLPASARLGGSSLEHRPRTPEVSVPSSFATPGRVQGLPAARPAACRLVKAVTCYRTPKTPDASTPSRTRGICFSIQHSKNPGAVPVFPGARKLHDEVCRSYRARHAWGFETQGLRVRGTLG